MPGERENGSSNADAGGREAGAEVEGLIIPDEAVPGAMVGEARPLGRDAASIEVSAVESKLSSEYVGSIVEDPTEGYDASDIVAILARLCSGLCERDGDTGADVVAALCTVCVVVDGTLSPEDEEGWSDEALPDSKIGLGEVGRDLARLEAKNDVLAEAAEGDSAGELTIRSLAGDENSAPACLLIVVVVLVCPPRTQFGA